MRLKRRPSLSHQWVLGGLGQPKDGSVRGPPSVSYLKVGVDCLGDAYPRRCRASLNLALGPVVSFSFFSLYNHPHSLLISYLPLRLHPTDWFVSSTFVILSLSSRDCPLHRNRFFIAFAALFFRQQSRSLHTIQPQTVSLFILNGALLHHVPLERLGYRLSSSFHHLIESYRGPER